MAYTVYEKFQDCRPNAQTGTGMIGIRRYQVASTAGEVLDPATIFNNPQIGAFLPQRNSNYAFQGYVLQAVGQSVRSTQSPHLVEVEITYDDFLLARKEESDSVLTNERYPIYVREPYYTSPAPGTPLQRQDRYVPRTMDFETSVGQVVLTIPLFKWTGADRTKCRKQIGKLHKIGEETFRFAQYRSTYLTQERWEITYRWQADPGFDGAQVNLGNSGDFIKPRYPAEGPPDPQHPEFQRLPFEKYLRVPSTITVGGLAGPPKIIMVPAPEAVPIAQVPLPVPYDGYILFPND